MPEYSSTTITPADGVQVPSMNGSTSGNFLLSALRDYILASKGQANGLASLGSDGKLTPSQLPDLADDVIVVASYAVLPATGTAGKIYITADNNKMYRWDADLSTPDYVQLSVDLSDYATLDDLAAEETARETADANLNDALSAHEKRIENLEEAHGSYHEVDVKSVYTIPSGKGSNWLIDGLRGVSRAKNNLVAPSNLRTRTDYGVTITANADGTITVSGTAEAQTNLDFTLTNFGTVGHSYVVCGGKSNGNIVINDGSHLATDSGAGAYLANATGTVKLQFPITNGVTYNVTITPCVTDLSVYFNGSIPSDADTIAEIQTNYPWLLTPSAYGTSAVNTVYEGVKSIGVNIWNEEWEEGALISDGSVMVNTYTNRRTTSFIRIDPNTAYFQTSPAGAYGGRIAFYDYNKNLVLFDNNGIPTTGLYAAPQGANYMRVTLGSAYGTTYNHDIQFCLYSLPSEVRTVYHPYMERTLTFPSPVSLKSAGAVAEEAYLNEDGQAWKTNPLGSYTFTGSEVWTQVNAYCYNASIVPTAKRPADDDAVANILLGGLVRTSANALYYGTIASGIALGGTDGKIYISASDYANRASLVGKVLSFELATPDPSTFVTPIIDNLIATEAGGTIESILMNPVDDSMTLGYINL